MIIEKNGFANDKILFAGVVNGKNIWKNNYKKTLAVLDSLKEKGIETVIGTSCSLLHVPYTLKNESKLPKKYAEHFAFAEEKLIELAELFFSQMLHFLKTDLIAAIPLYRNEFQKSEKKILQGFLNLLSEKKYRKKNLISLPSRQQQSVHFRRLPM